MCIVSDKLKLCTCKGNTIMAQNYWVLHPFVKGKNEVIMGTDVMPATIDPLKDKFNQDLLPQLLNDENVLIHHFSNHN